MPRVKLPDGSTAVFPDDMSASDIEAVLSKQFGGVDAPAAPAKPRGFLDRVGQGAADLATGFGKVGGHILAPYDLAVDAVQGRTLGASNRERLAAIEQFGKEQGADNWTSVVNQAVPEVLATGKPLGAVRSTVVKALPTVLPKAVSKVAPVVADVGTQALYEGAKSLAETGGDFGAAGKAALYGGAGSFLLGDVVPAIGGRFIRPTTAGPAAQRLIDQGVEPTFGQVMAEKAADKGLGMLPRAGARAAALAEEAATSTPLAGAPLRSMRERSLEGFQRASREAALPPGAAREAAENIPDIAAAFDVAYPQALQGAQFARGAPNPFATAQADIGTVIAASSRARALAPAEATRASEFVQRAIDSVDPAIAGTPEHAHVVERLLKGEAYANTGAYANMLRDVTTAWRNRWRGAVTPDTAQNLAAVDEAFSKFAPVREAAKKVSSTEPQAYTPKQLITAIKQQDKTANKSRYLGGTMPQQQLAADADLVLGNKLADSGTAMRAATMGGLLGAGGVVATAPAALGAGALALYGTRPVQRWLTGRSGAAAQRAMERGLQQISTLPPAQQEAAMRALLSQIGRVTGEEFQE